MRLNKSSKVVLGILTFLPLVVGVGSVIFGIYQLMSLFFSEDPAVPVIFLSYLSYIIPYLFSFFFVYLGLEIFYLIHVLKNKFLDSEKKFLWVVVLFILNAISMPVYWYVHIWKDNFSRNLESDSAFDNSYESGTQSQKL